MLLAQIVELEGNYAKNESNHEVWIYHYVHLDKQTEQKQNPKQFI